VHRDDPAYRGQRDYTRPVLNLYDPLVLGPIARHVWHSPAEQLVELYRQHIRDGHLDVGPGTGYFVDRSGLADGSRVTLVDPNRNVLRHAARRLRRLNVTPVEADILKPLAVSGPFSSAALSLVIHCLPGPMERKAAAVANVAAVLAPDGVLFGATVLGRAGHHSRLARAFLWTFNRQGGFDNLNDTEDGLDGILRQSFADVRIEVIGSSAMFVAREPRSPAPPSGDTGILPRRIGDEPPVAAYREADDV
jgi:SAM-dependent methyltransferase